MKQLFVEVIELLKKHELTISTCESITGGMIASMLVQVPGASKVYKGGYVVYSNEAKMKLANVSQETLNKHGAISKECAIEMGINTAKKLRTDIAIAITGNAGPLPDENKPVGEAWLSISLIDLSYTYKLNAKSTDRNDIRIEMTAMAFEKLIEIIKKTCK